MKKYIIPILLAVLVFCITVFFQRFTILRQEGLGLFLNTPDFYRALFFDAFPLSNLIGSFLVQFYSNFYVGSAIVAIIVVSEYLVVRAILARLGIKAESLCMLCACTAWFFIAKAANPSMGVAILLCSSVPLIALALILGRKISARHALPKAVDIVCCIIVAASASSLVALHHDIREGEKWSRIEFAAVQGEWKFLLKNATPRMAQKDMNIVPYALLALNVQGRLADEIDRYPLMENLGLDYGDEVSYRRSLFDAVLYYNLGCYNEAIHRTHQCGDFLPHCTSFRTLRMLVKENYALGDSLMVVKYCDILDKSLTHKEFTSYFRQNPCPQRVPDSARVSSESLLIVTNDPMEIMLRLGRAGINSPMIMERYYAYFKLREYYRTHKQ